MSYVGDPFRHDIFVTYSHGDPDDTGASKLRRWSQGFARELESELKTIPELGPDIRVYFDQHPRPAQGVDPMAALSDQLRNDIGHSGILVVLMSPHYLRSNWCRDERDWWCARQAELKFSCDERIAVARIWPTKEAWPECLADQRGKQLVGFYFYDRGQADDKPWPFEWPEPGEHSRNPFRLVLQDLVGSLRLKLHKLRERLEERRKARAETAKLAASGGQVVYLHGRTDHASEWEKANDALTSSGLVVMPNEPDPVPGTVRNPEEIQKIRNERVLTMSGCDALLLLATGDGRAVDADLVVVGRQDREFVRSTWNRLLPCAVLDGAGEIVATPKRKLAARSLNVAWIDATREPWTPKVQQWLVEVSHAEAAT